MGAVLWNNLPIELRQADALKSIKAGYACKFLSHNQVFFLVTHLTQLRACQFSFFHTIFN